MQQRPKTETQHGAASEAAAAPAKPPRLKAKTVEFASKKQLQFESPLPLRRSRATTATMTMKTTTAAETTTTTATTTKLRQGKTTKRTAPPAVAAEDAQTDVAATTIVSATTNVSAPAAAATRTRTTRTTAIKTRLAVGCSSLMYACQHGDIVQVLAQMRAKVGAQSLELSGTEGERETARSRGDSLTRNMTS